MANELKINMSATAEKGNFKFSWPLGQIQVTINGTAARAGNSQSIGTAAGGEALAIGSDLTTEGYVFLTNTDATNFVTIGVQNGTTSDMEPWGRLKAGESAVFRMEPGVTLMAQADTAAVVLDVNVLED